MMPDRPHADLVASLTEAMRGFDIDRINAYAFGAIEGYANSPVAFSPIERLSRIRAVIEAVEAVRAELG